MEGFFLNFIWSWWRLVRMDLSVWSLISMHRTWLVFLACFVFAFSFYFDEFMALVCLFCLIYVSTSLKENLCSCCGWTDINQIILEAQQRWLRPAEICEILRNYQNFCIAPEPPNKPPSKILCCVVYWMLNFACDLMNLSLYHLILYYLYLLNIISHDAVSFGQNCWDLSKWIHFYFIIWQLWRLVSRFAYFPDRTVWLWFLF